MLSVEPNPRVTFRVRHEDDDLLVIEKPARIVTQPGKAHEHDTLLNGLFALHGRRLQKLGASRGFGLVHRLDKETSGVLAVALSVRGYEGLRAQFERREVRKSYWAVCRKAPSREKGVVKTPIAEQVIRLNRWSSKKLAKLSSANGKPAVTAFRVLEESELAALIEARPLTGRLHQVRLHLDSIGATVLGDAEYGPRSCRHASPRLALHAWRLGFDHPVTGEAIDIRTGWPKDLRSLLRRMRLDGPTKQTPAEDRAGSDEGSHEIAGDTVRE
ncbi:MAG: RluA family pseudouridine synthase [Planctomycetota bacterium]